MSDSHCELDSDPVWDDVSLTWGGKWWGGSNDGGSAGILVHQDFQTSGMSGTVDTDVCDRLALQSGWLHIFYGRIWTGSRIWRKRYVTVDSAS